MGTEEIRTMTRDGLADNFIEAAERLRPIIILKATEKTGTSQFNLLNLSKNT